MITWTHYNAFNSLIGFRILHLYHVASRDRFPCLASTALKLISWAHDHPVDDSNIRHPPLNHHERPFFVQEGGQGC